LNRKSYVSFLFVSLLVSVTFTYYYFLYTHEYPRGSSEEIANFEAYKVFQTRILIPYMATLMSPTSPVLIYLFDWIVPYPIDYQVHLQIINISFLLLLLISFPFLLRFLKCESNNWLSLLLMIPISWNYIFINGFIDGTGLYYSYDIPSLSFFVIGLLLFCKKKWQWFYPIFIFSCLNRETSCFITLSGFVLLINIDKYEINEIFKKNKSLFYHVFLQAIIWTSIRLILSYIFRNNPGDFFEEPHSIGEFIYCIYLKESHWAMNNPRWFLSLFAGIWIIPLIFFRYLGPIGIKFLFIALCYTVALFLRSNMMETRVYNELNIIISLCAFISVKEWLFRNKIEDVKI